VFSLFRDCRHRENVIENSSMPPSPDGDAALQALYTQFPALDREVVDDVFREHGAGSAALLASIAGEGPPSAAGGDVLPIPMARPPAGFTVAPHLRAGAHPCYVCRQRPRGIMFLPCRHHYACPQCAAGIAACPLCLAAVEETVVVAVSVPTLVVPGQRRGPRGAAGTFVPPVASTLFDNVPARTATFRPPVRPQGPAGVPHFRPPGQAPAAAPAPAPAAAAPEAPPALPVAELDATLDEGDGGDDERELCQICFDAPRDIVFRPCNHHYTCGPCAERLRRQCPLCKQAIRSKESCAPANPTMVPWANARRAAPQS
jgi:hypothetical protein